MHQVNPAHDHLLAVDLGLRSGMAVYGRDGRLKAYGSQHFGSREQLKRAAQRLVPATARSGWLISEGDYALAAIWERVAMRQGTRVQRVSPEAWREALLTPSERRDAQGAKKAAVALAQRIIAWSGAPRPSSLTVDCAEAICVGLWGAVAVGWLDSVPAAVAQPEAKIHAFTPRTSLAPKVARRALETFKRVG